MANPLGREAPIALVTGASGAIGAAICLALERSGCQVAGADVLGAESDRFHLRLRLDDPEAVDRAFDEIYASVGPVSVLVNNAGTYLAQDFLDTSPDQLETVLGGNLKSTFFCSQAFARRLIPQHRPGVVVNVASISGRMGSPDAAYGAAKGAVLALTRGLGKSLAPHGIRVNAVAPGVIDSAMSARIPDERAEHYREQTPLGRFGSPGEVAAAVAWLAGPGSSYVTGAVLDVNGGLW